MGRRRIGTKLREGLAATRPYLLSHHEPAAYHRCYTISASRNIRLCARCTGIYPGIGLGLATAWLDLVPVAPLVLIAVFPLPALLDWVVTNFTAVRGSNAVRTLSGAALGFAYGIGLVELFLGGDHRVVLVGVGYALVAGTLLALRERRAT